jgi:hypothetical protein
MAGDWKESKERTVYFPEDDPDILRIDIHHLYTGTLAEGPDTISDDYKGYD